MSNENFATESEKEYFYFNFALQNESGVLRTYVRRAEELFAKLDKEMKKLVRSKPISPLETFSVADQCLKAYHGILKRAHNEVVINYCSKKYNQVLGAREILSKLFPR